MSLTVKNIGCMQYAGGASLARPNTIPANTYGEVGTVRVVFEGREYVFGPNQSITFADDGVGIAVAAADSRLRVKNEVDGARVVLESSGGAGISQPSCAVRYY